MKGVDEDRTHVGFVHIEFSTKREGLFAVQYEEKKDFGCFSFIYGELDMFEEIKIFINVYS